MRPSDWPSRLALYVEECRTRRFEWGVWDCALNCADWFVILGRTDPAAELRGRYRTAIGAARALHRLGLREVDQLPGWAGLEEVRPTLAQRGDLVSVAFVHEGRERLALAVCDVFHAIAAAIDEFDMFVPRDKWRRAWRV